MATVTTDLTTRVAELAATIGDHLNTDERTAHAAITAKGQWYQDGSGEWAVDGTSIRDSSGGYIVFDEGCPTSEQFEHIARQDPARTLRHVAATRELVAFAFKNAATIDGEWGCCHSAAEIAAGQCNDQGARAAVRLLGIIASQWEDQ